MTAAAAVLAALAVIVLLAPSRSALGRVFPTSRTARLRVPGPSRPAVSCAVAGGAVAAVGASPAAVVAGLAVALAGPRLLARLEPRAVRVRRERLRADLPLVLDLLSACLAGGAALPAAAAAVGAAVPGPAGQRLAAVGSALAVGLPPEDAWLALGGGGTGDPGPDDPLLPVARALARAAEGGAPVAETVSRMAAEARAEARGHGEQAARRVGVLAVAPLGLCFLPAFALLGVVPVVVGLAGPLLAAF